MSATMSSHQQEQVQILQTCQQINEMLEISKQNFTLQGLTHINWYITTLQLIYPYLSQKFNQIKKIPNEALAINKLLYMLTKEEIIEEDFLEIKGEDIVQGDIESIYYIVQLLNALIQREVEGDEDQGNSKEENIESYQNEEDEEQRHHSDLKDSHAKPKGSKDQLAQKQFQPKPFQNSISNDGSNNGRNVFSHYESHSQDQPVHQEGRHSVLGIQNEFEDTQDEEYDDEEFAAANIKKKKSVQQEQKIKVKNNNAPHKQGLQPNIYFNPSQKQQTNHVRQQVLVSISKPTKNQSQSQEKKMFSSSESEQEINFYEQKAKSKKQSKESKKLFVLKPDSESEDDNDYSINPTIKKHKSDVKLLKESGKKRSTIKKKNLVGYSSLLLASNQSKRQLVTYPTIKKKQRKATNPEAKKLTQQVKEKISTILKKKNKKTVLTSSSMNNTTASMMQRKKKELKVKLRDWQKEVHIYEKPKHKSVSRQMRSNVDLRKILNGREGQLKKEKKQFEKAMEMKLQFQKESYIKKINTLLLKLQKEKQLYERQQYKQRLLQQNQEAAKRLTAIQQWYKGRIQFLKQSNKHNRNGRSLMHTGHKEILKKIEKQLKRENEKKIMNMTMRFRRQQAEIQNDLEELQREILQVYKKN